MSAVESVPLHLDPADILLDKGLDLRRFKIVGEGAEDRAESIKALAASMIQNGQENPVLIREKKGKYYLVAGSRRREAGLLINSGALKSLYDPKKQGPFLLESKLRELDDTQAHRAAMHENIQREDFSPIQLLLNIQDTRKRYGWEGESGTKNVAEFLGLTVTDVTETEKLDLLPKAVKAQVHAGTLTAEGALFAAKKVQPEKVEEVLADAGKGAKKEAQERLEKEEKNPKSSKQTKDRLKKKVEKPVVGKKHVAAAAQKKGALKEGVKEPRNRKALLEFFDGMRGAASHPLMAEFAEYLVDKYAPGDGTDGKLTKLWDAIGDALPKVKAAGKSKAAA